MEVRLATEAAPGRPVNEDGALAVGSLVAVFDGVTQPDGVDTGCHHGPAWYVRRLTMRLIEAYIAQPDEPLPSLLAGAIEAVRPDHGGGCDLGHPGTPAASVALLRDVGDRIEYLLLTDAVLVLDRGGSVEVVTDRRFERATAQVRRAALVSGRSARRTTPRVLGGRLNRSGAIPTNPAGTGSRRPIRRQRSKPSRASQSSTGRPC
jgi:hypothetical protein